MAFSSRIIKGRIYPSDYPVTHWLLAIFSLLCLLGFAVAAGLVFTDVVDWFVEDIYCVDRPDECIPRVNPKPAIVFEVSP